jgi:nucleoside-diphosphate-sugar epimerase
LQNTLVIGSGRVGLAITNELLTLNYKALNVGIRAQSELRQAFDELCEFDTIFWCARDAGTPDNETNCEEVFLNLLRQLELSVWKGLFVFLSTAGEIYGDSNIIENSEESPANPSSLYGERKLSHEKEISKISIKVGFKALILRISNIYELNTEDQGVVGSILRHLVMQESLTITGGYQKRDFILLSDVAKISIKLAEKNCESLFNIATGFPKSILNLMSLFEKALNKKAEPLLNEDFRGVVTANFSIAKMASVIEDLPRNIDSVVRLYFQKPNLFLEK